MEASFQVRADLPRRNERIVAGRVVSTTGREASWEGVAPFASTVSLHDVKNDVERSEVGQMLSGVPERCRGFPLQFAFVRQGGSNRGVDVLWIGSSVKRNDTAAPESDLDRRIEG